VKCAVEKALECKKKNEKKTIVFNLSGHGILDVGGYQKFLEARCSRSSFFFLRL
jgi:tryptophan synthase beta chain